MNTNGNKRKAEGITNEAISKLNRKNPTHVINKQSGDIINVMGNIDLEGCEDNQRLKTEIKYLKKIIESKDETIASKDAYIKLLEDK